VVTAEEVKSAGETPAVRKATLLIGGVRAAKLSDLAGEASGVETLSVSMAIWHGCPSNLRVKAVSGRFREAKPVAFEFRELQKSAARGNRTAKGRPARCCFVGAKACLQAPTL